MFKKFSRYCDASCYEWRVMGGDELTSESAITINKCSSLLSFHTIDNTRWAVIC